MKNRLVREADRSPPPRSLRVVAPLDSMARVTLLRPSIALLGSGSRDLALLFRRLPAFAVILIGGERLAALFAASRASVAAVAWGRRIVLALVTLAALLIWLARLVSLVVCHLVFRFPASRPLGRHGPTKDLQSLSRNP